MENNETINFYTNRYYNDFLPYQEKINSWAYSKIGDQKDLILGGLIKAIHEMIPEGKWKILMDELFSFQLPSDESSTEKIKFSELLSNRMCSTIGVVIVKIPKHSILKSGFKSWADFIEKIPELQDLTKDIFFLGYMKGVDMDRNEKLFEHHLIFSITCIPQKYYDHRDKVLEKIRNFQ